MSQVAPVAERVESLIVRAARVVAPERIEVVETEIAAPGAGEVRVRLEGCGVCSSNIPPWEGREWFSYPMEPGALGHEGWGRIEALGEEVEGFEVGDRVAFIGSHSYAEAENVAASSLIRIPDSLEGTPFPGEPLGCAMNIYRRSGIRSGDVVAIVGIGFLGALLTQLASLDGARVIAVARKESVLDLATQMGAAETVLMDDHWRIIEQVKGLTSGSFCDVVIEATGKQWPLDLAAELTKERGRLIVAGYHQDGMRQVNMQLWNWRGLDVINAHERDPQVYLDGIRSAIEAVESGRMDPSGLYTHTFKLNELSRALELTRERPDGFMKALVMMS